MAAVLLTVWKRPEQVLRVINVLREYKPKKVYVSCDGPNINIEGQKEKVLKTRSIIDQSIDWDCNLYKNYSDVNLGCRDGMTKAIDWFFNNEEEGIIIEDDCLPNIEFFEYCDNLLEKYRFNERIFSISGCNRHNGLIRGEYSYFFSRYVHVWGWAGWRRSWKKYDKSMQEWEKFKRFANINSFFISKREKSFWIETFDNLTKLNVPDTWDYQWVFAHILNDALSIIPNSNLISNIGFGTDSTHSFAPPKTQITKNIIPIKHPQYVIRDKEADIYYFENEFKRNFPKKLLNIFRNPRYYIDKILSKFYKFLN